MLLRKNWVSIKLKVSSCHACAGPSSFTIGQHQPSSPKRKAVEGSFTCVNTCYSSTKLRSLLSCTCYTTTRSVFRSIITIFRTCLLMTKPPVGILPWISCRRKKSVVRSLITMFRMFPPCFVFLTDRKRESADWPPWNCSIPPNQFSLLLLREICRCEVPPLPSDHFRFRTLSARDQKNFIRSIRDFVLCKEKKCFLSCFLGGRLKTLRNDREVLNTCRHPAGSVENVTVCCG